MSIAHSINTYHSHIEVVYRRPVLIIPAQTILSHLTNIHNTSTSAILNYVVISRITAVQSSRTILHPLYMNISRSVITSNTCETYLTYNNERRCAINETHTQVTTRYSKVTQRVPTSTCVHNFHGCSQTPSFILCT